MGTLMGPKKSWINIYPVTPPEKMSFGPPKPYHPNTATQEVFGCLRVGKWKETIPEKLSGDLVGTDHSLQSCLDDGFGSQGEIFGEIFFPGGRGRGDAPKMTLFGGWGFSGSFARKCFVGFKKDNWWFASWQDGFVLDFEMIIFLKSMLTHVMMTLTQRGAGTFSCNWCSCSSSKKMDPRNYLMCKLYFPTCQVRVVRFYVSCLLLWHVMVGIPRSKVILLVHGHGSLRLFLFIAGAFAIISSRNEGTEAAWGFSEASIKSPLMYVDSGWCAVYLLE